MASESDKSSANLIPELFSNINTFRNTQWSFNTWKDWCAGINSTKTETDTDLIPTLDELALLPVTDIDKILKKFVEDLQAPDGNDYPPETVRCILYGVQRHLRMTIPDVNLFEKGSESFKTFQDAFFKKVAELSTKGITPVRKKQGQAVTEEQEKRLWEKGAFHFHNSVALSNAVFFYTCKVFGLIAGDSLRKLDTKHFRFDEDVLGKFVELHGDFAHAASCRHYKLGMDPINGAIRQYQDESNPRCYYNLMVHYLKQISRAQLTGPLFLKPQQNQLFTNQALGENNLASKLGTIMKTYHIDGYYTNHSIIQGVTMTMGWHGINLRKLNGSAYGILDVCKILDPPPGYVPETEEDNLVPCIPPVTSKAGTIILQQHGTQFILQQEANAYQASVLPAVSLPLPARKIKSAKPRVRARRSKDNSVITIRPIQPKVKPETQEELSDLASQSNTEMKEVFPLYLSAADSTSTQNESQGEGETAEEGQESLSSEDINQFINTQIIKEEPVDNYEYYGNETATTTNEQQMYEEDSNDTSTSETSATITSTANNYKQESNAANSRKRKLSQTEPNSEPKLESKTIDNSNKSESMNTAEVALSFTKNSETGMLKQDVNVMDNDQDVFTSSSSYKTGRPVPDYDFTLGDFLPENSVIRPSDIQIKRIATPNGGKIVLQVKYSDTK